MAVSYNKISKHPNIFLRLFGVKKEEFDLLLNKLQVSWDEKIIKQYKRPGRHYKLSFQQMFMMMLIYYRTYSTQIQIGFMFGLDDSRVCRIIKKIEPLVAKLVAIKKNRALSYEEAAQLIDVTEQVIERPKKGQKQYFSGKKRRHTLKTEIRVTPKGEITNISRAYRGKVHDFKIHKESDRIAVGTRVYADSGYQGIKKRSKNAKIPIKKRHKKALSFWEKAYNKVIAKKRIKVENVIAQLKNFRILSYRYRNKRKGYNLKFNIIGGLVNLKQGFLSQGLAA